MPVTIDVTGLPEPVVHDIQQLVNTLRARLASGNGAPPRAETAEEWIARFLAWAASHPVRDVVIDDSRESIYEGRGE